MLVRAVGVPIPLQIPLASLVAFGVSWLLVAAAYKYFGKKTRWVLG